MVKKKITLRRIFHREEWRYAIIFTYDTSLVAAARSIPGIRWSKTNKCWHSPANEDTLKHILKAFRNVADIDISKIVSDEKNVIPEQSGINVPVKDEIVEFSNEDKTVPSRGEYVSKAIRSVYDPVSFTINESHGRLVIKFTGKYNSKWIDEMKVHGKLFYDKLHKEWMLPWSKITVDSLSDYFQSCGVDVIVKKNKVSEKLKKVRDDNGADIRNRELGTDKLSSIEHFRKFLEEKRYSTKTISSYISHIELFFKYFIDQDLGKIKEKDISFFINDFVIRLGYSSSYQNLLISSIKLYYSFTDERRISLVSLERPRRSRALPKVFSKDEVMKIFAAARNSKHKLMLWFIYSCGLRRSEVINIRLTDLDRERGILHIREAKGNVDRIVPVPVKLWDKIEPYRKAYSPVVYLFEGQNGGKYSVESVYMVFKQALRRAGIKKDVGVHSLRHSYATHLHESGLDIRYIQELLGHKSTRTTEIYTHVSRRNLFAVRSPIEDMDID
jgi:integrase/recombinase XerD